MSHIDVKPKLHLEIRRDSMRWEENFRIFNEFSGFLADLK
jgi:hypothetical protein